MNNKINTTNITGNISIEEVKCETKYNQLREEIIKAVPEIRYKVGIGNYPYRKETTKERLISLEDCLIAGFKSLPKMRLGYPKSQEIYKKYEKFVIDITLQESQWRLGKPLQDQSEETLTMLADLLL